MLLVVIIVVGGYLAYVFISYDRVEDRVELSVNNDGVSSENGIVPTNEALTVTSYNIGFAAYTRDYGFFMDGGEESRAFSKDAVNTNMNDIIALLNKLDTDFYLLDEVDVDATRTYGVNEVKMITEAKSGYANVFAENWDSAYLFYPVTCPTGAAYTGLVTLSRYNITSALRRSLPKDTGVMKIVDLDRCYSVSRIPTSDGKELVLYTFHLSAYSSGAGIGDGQLEMMIADMQKEYKAGNYVVGGGDFNKNLLASSPKNWNQEGVEMSWTAAFPTNVLKDTNISLVGPYDETNPVPSCRDANGPADKEGQLRITVDGFLVSDNIKVISSEVYDTDFAYSDHNPVVMTFSLEPTVEPSEE